MTVRAMRRDELDLLLAWAAEEGWNPGLDDADAFFAADPDGFFVNEVDGQMAAAISVVNHDSRFAFLGLYICHPAYRGQGHGFELWSRAMTHAGARSVGLDGVPEQQGNYARSGFNRQGKTVRFMGELNSGTWRSAVTFQDLDKLAAYDHKATGVARTEFTRHWFADTASRKTICLSEIDPSAGFATFRRCGEGVKIGPFYAEGADAAAQLLAGVPAEFGSGPVFVDVPEQAPDFANMLSSRGFQPVFETARMWSAQPPTADLPAYAGVATLELG